MGFLKLAEGKLKVVRLRIPADVLVPARKRRLNNARFTSGFQVAAVVIVDGVSHRTRVAAKPPIGAILDIGFAVVVTHARDVAGGGVLVAADRVDAELSA